MKEDSAASAAKAKAARAAKEEREKERAREKERERTRRSGCHAPSSVTLPHLPALSELPCHGDSCMRARAIASK